MKNILYILIFLLTLQLTAQVKMNNKTEDLSQATGTAAFLDAASNQSFDNADGKGLGFPRVDLTSFVFNAATLASMDGIVFPTYLDGLMVYNSGSGSTLGTQYLSTVVSPGFYYFSNPGSVFDLTAGKWLPLGAGSLPATTVSNTSTGNTATVTVNGVTSTGAPIINSVTNGVTGTSLTTTVNGFAGTPLDLSPFVATAVTAVTTNTLGLAGNTLTSMVNGKVATSSAVSGVSNTLTGTSLTTTVNGFAGTPLDLSPFVIAALPAVTTNTLSISGNTLTSTVNSKVATSSAVSGVSNTLTGSNLSTTVNGVTGTAVDLSPMVTSALPAATTNTLALSDNTITSTVNGKVATSPAVSGVSNSVSGGFLYTTVNGISSGGYAISSIVPDATTLAKGIVQLAGDLTGTAALPTIATDAVTSAKILDGTIATADIADNAVTVAKLPVGATPTTFLRGDGTWVNPTATVITTIRHINFANPVSDRTILATDHTILCDATTGFALTLPAAATSSGVEYVIRKTDETNNILSFGATSIKVSESTSISDVNYTTTLRIQSDGTNWWLIQ